MSEAAGPVILLTAPPSEGREALLRSRVPAARIVRESDLAADPDLVSRIEICYPALPPALWREARGLKWLQTSFAGVDGLLSLPEARAHPAVITNVHIHAASVAEHLWGMALALTRNLHVSAQAQAAATWSTARVSQGLSSLAGRTLCIAGLGVIGARCAELGRAFGMRVVAISRRARDNPLVDRVVGPDERRQAFAESRVIMLVLPETAETRGFVGKAELDVMKGSYLLNAGRGSSVVTDALVEALRDGRVRGAGLDVTDPEPLPPDHPLWRMPNVVITPHYAGVHPGYEEESFAVFIENLQRWMRGEELLHVVDKSAGY